MNLTDRDVERVKYLRDVLQTRSEAQVVSIALSLTGYIVSELRKPDTQLLLRNADGTLDRVVMHELSSIPALRPSPPRGAEAR